MYPFFSQGSVVKRDPGIATRTLDSHVLWLAPRVVGCAISFRISPPAIRTSYFAFHVAFDADHMYDYMNRIFVHILQQQSPKSMMPWGHIPQTNIFGIQLTLGCAVARAPWRLHKPHSSVERIEISQPILPDITTYIYIYIHLYMYINWSM